ncbi:MAG TPA: hypothetical protein VGX21_08235 [Methylomirabilota bacterium]|jgi:hypothetical protein|nr:hypothetical protein [Methylomirabilota bacterium]
MAIAEPYAYLDLDDGASIRFRVLDWEEKREHRITPRHAPDGKLVRLVRVHVPPADKPDFPHYWDFTQARLVAQLVPQLVRGDVRSLRFVVTAHGASTKKMFTLDVARV